MMSSLGPLAVGTGVDTGGGSKSFVGTTEVVVGASQAVGSGSSRISWRAAALARETIRNTRENVRSMVKAGVCVGEYLNIMF